MRDSIVQLRQRGVLTLPRKLREKYGLEEGDVLAVIDLGGVILLSPKLSVLPKLTAEMVRLRAEAGVSVAELVAGVHRERGRRK